MRLIKALWDAGEGFLQPLEVLVERRGAQIVELDPDAVLTPVGEDMLMGWGKLDGPCVVVAREGVGRYRVPRDVWQSI